MNGAMVSAVDLLKGIAVEWNMRNLDMKLWRSWHELIWESDGSGWSISLKNDDFSAYIHVEAPDERSVIRKSLENKIKAIEHLIKKLREGCQRRTEAGEDFNSDRTGSSDTIAIRTIPKNRYHLWSRQHEDYEGQEEQKKQRKRQELSFPRLWFNRWLLQK